VASRAGARDRAARSGTTGVRSGHGSPGLDLSGVGLGERRGGKEARDEMTTATWRQRAKCRGLDTTLFYPSPEEDAEEAKAVCEACVVREACLEHALFHREAEGVWGGLTERERRRILRRRRESA